MTNGLHRSLTRAALLALLGAGTLAAQSPDSAATARALARSVLQLRESVGDWEVETRFLNADGSVARSVRGSYHFEWVTPDAVLMGSSRIPELNSASGILFYISATRGVIEMVSVGADGTLWTMTGPLGGEERQTAPFALPGGVERRLRFTRQPVTPDSMESRMHFSDDGGRTWIPGNHQVFRRRSG